MVLVEVIKTSSQKITSFGSSPDFFKLLEDGSPSRKREAHAGKDFAAKAQALA
jgi:hypothetical protein